MKTKAPLAMLEQLVMLLVFSLAAALCLQAFVMSDQTSQANARRDLAVTEVQQTAEVIRFCAGDLEQARQILGGSLDGDVLTVPGESGTVTAVLTKSGHALLGTAEVFATDDSGTELFCVPVSWQTGESR